MPALSRFPASLLLAACLALSPAAARAQAAGEVAVSADALPRPPVPDPARIGFLFSSVKDDRVYNSLAAAAIRAFEAETGMQVRQRVVDGPAESFDAIRAFAERGVGSIFLVGFVHEEPVAALAARYPQVRFTLVDGRVEAPNVRSILFREQEAGYLVGLAAGLSSRTGTVAFIGGMPIPPVRRFGCGFLQGVRDARPELKVLTRYLATQGDGFRERDKARWFARELLGQGADVVFAAAGVAGHDVLDVAASAGKLGIGVDSNQNALYPGRVLTSALKRVDVAVAGALRDVQSGRWAPGVVELGLAEGGVDWAVDPHNDPLVAPYAKQVGQARAAIAAGTLRVEDRPDLEQCRG